MLFYFDILHSWHEISLRDLNQISIERDISETSQKYLKRDVFFVTSLRRLKYISKKMSFFVASLRRLKNISRKYFWFFKNISQISCDFRRVITISDKIDVGPSETLWKWNVLWEQCIDINQVCPVGWYLHESFGKSRIVKTQ